jgi:secretion/DNA translocation related TadE-like protein
VSRDQRGSATLLAVSFLGVLLLVGAALGVVAAMLGAHRSAQAAADLAALAAATELRHGGDSCGRASQIARANGAGLRSCTVQGEAVVVEVTVTGPRWLSQRGDLSARARAGPG